MAIWILINYFPVIYWTCSALAALRVFHEESRTIFVCTLLFFIYLLPPLLCRLTFLFLPTPKRRSPVPSKAAYSWWISSQLQVTYLRLPFLEELLRMIPGAYSAWLRLWGAKIGKFVYWAPGVVIADRSHIEIGNFVLFGYGSKLTSHGLVKRKNGKSYLIFSPIKIEDHALVGTLSGMGPGCRVAKNTTLPANAVLTIFSTWDEALGQEVKIPRLKP